ncbi:MAG: hypothetical protein MUP49_01715 [Dehalococcoidia bacterium]|nr:hypothetical protein [Dehalococcoidia bacterium]
MNTKVFESHTKLDSEFCDVFDRACARVGIDAFRSEYESIEPPAWQTIRNELRQSKALFLLVGKALINAQKTHSSDWEYTQNWISYEIGIASQLGIDVWVLCDEVEINFPVPYFNNYIPYSIRRENNFKSFVSVLQNYANGKKYGLDDAYAITCPYSDCSITYNLHARVPKGGKVLCPCCLGSIVWREARYESE